MKEAVKPVYTRDAVKVVCDSPISNKAMISIGGVGIPCQSADIHIETGEWVTVKLVVRADLIDVEALQSQTQVTVVEPEDAQS